MCKKDDDNKREAKERFISIACLCLHCFVKDKIYKNGKIKKWRVFFYLIPFLLMSGIGYLLILDNSTVNNTEKLFSYGISSTTTLLGFLTSGFAIFAALSDRNLIYFMNNIPPNRDIKNIDSLYQETQIYFFEPFIFLGATCVISFIGIWMLMIWPVLEQFVSELIYFKKWFCLMYGLYFYLFFLSFISLKDFVFNLFQIGKLYSGFQSLNPDVSDNLKEILSRYSSNRNDQEK